MLRKTQIPFFLLLSLYGGLYAQPSFGQEVDYHMANQGFLIPSIISRVYSNTGFQVFETSLEPYSLVLSQSSLPSDSNAYSVVNFNLGTIATQNIGIVLSRPFGLGNNFDLKVYRESNPGWVASSFVRRTDIDMSYYHKVSERLKVSTDIGVYILDREQNGGVKDSIMYSLTSRGVTELNLEGNVWLANAYNRRSRLYNYLKGEYSFMQSQNLRVNGSLESMISRFQFNYNDELTDSSYYSNFSSESINTTIEDSTSITSISMIPGLDLLYEFNDSFALKAFLGVDQSWYWYTNNSISSNPMNQAIIGNVDIATTRLEIESDVYSCIEGYNKGDYRTRGGQTINLIGSDSGDFRSTIGLNQLLQKRRPTRIYERFESNVVSNSLELEKLSIQQYSGHLRAMMGKFRSQIKGEYLVIGNYVFFDERAQVNQILRNIETYSAEIQFAYSTSFVSLSTNGRYQWNNDSKFYSIPKWINRSSVCFYWNLLDKRLRMSSGISTLYFSGYYSQGYLPFFDVNYTQSFHRFDDYFQTDVFIATQIKSVSVGVKVYNALYGIVNDNPIIAPNLPSVPRFLSLQFQWKFKN